MKSGLIKPTYLWASSWYPWVPGSPSWVSGERGLTLRDKVQSPVEMWKANRFPACKLLASGGSLFLRGVFRVENMITKFCASYVLGPEVSFFSLHPHYSVNYHLHFTQEERLIILLPSLCWCASGLIYRFLCPQVHHHWGRTDLPSVCPPVIHSFIKYLLCGWCLCLPWKFNEIPNPKLRSHAFSF